MATRTGASAPLVILWFPPPLLGLGPECAPTAGANLAKDVCGNRRGQVFGEGAHVRRDAVLTRGPPASLGQFCTPRHLHLLPQLRSAVREAPARAEARL